MSKHLRKLLWIVCFSSLVWACGGEETASNHTPDGDPWIENEDVGEDAPVEDAPAPSCDDEVKNGQETDIDCGGPDCSPCGSGKVCDVARDCTSEVCRQGVCAPPECNDGVLNGQETDVDCGGPDCGGCKSELECDVDDDCLSRNCPDGTCVYDDCDVVTCDSDQSCYRGICYDSCDASMVCDEDSRCYRAQHCAPSDCAQVGCADGESCSQGICYPACSTGEDCEEGTCTEGSCVVPICEDGLQNGEETSVDCGGPDCSPCEGGASCEDDSDCQNQTCLEGACAASCALPWGGSIGHGENVTAYQAATEECGSECESETRTCDNGTLSGSYTEQSCSAPCADCPAETVSWDDCEGEATSVAHQETQTVSNIAADYLGEATYLCEDGVWTFQSGTCLADPTDTNNLLQNPGAETGDISPWTTSGALSFYVHDGSTTTSGGSIGPTEATHWFRSDGASGAHNRGSISQTVDVSSFNMSSGQVEVVYGGDSFATSTRSSPARSTDARYEVEFLDQNGDAIASHDSGRIMSQEQSPEETLDHRTVTDVPSGTTSIRFEAIAIDGTRYTTRHGFDALHLSLQTP